MASVLGSRIGADGPPQSTDVLIVGAGIAGLSIALRLPSSLRVMVVTKGALGESNTWYAQGGIAAAVGIDDDPALHLADTLVAGAELCDESATRTLVEGGPAAITWLLERGTQFDRDRRALALGKEAAHSRNRVLHAGGDATGAEIERSLVAQLRDRPGIAVLESSQALDLIVNADGTCAGAVIESAATQKRIPVMAQATILANGGAGRLWSVTSNPPGATGDGVAMAMRAGVDVADLEFTQFHPTVLAVPGADPFLITEAIRGEGAYLLDIHSERFMLQVHPLAELAPRDVVARAIQDQITRHSGQPVFLDLRHLDPNMVMRRFPTIADRLASHGLSLTDDLVPVAPAAHYFMGGIVADSTGHTSMPGLFAVGEVSCTGVHGANRLASNSLLEGLVFGLMTADHLGDTLMPDPVDDSGQVLPNPLSPIGAANPGAVSVAQAAIQKLMGEHVAVVRSRDGLEMTRSELARIAGHVTEWSGTDATQVRNMLTLAMAITDAALAREESRGGHYRSDFPETDPELDHQHQVISTNDGVITRRFGSLRTSDVS